MQCIITFAYYCSGKWDKLWIRFFVWLLVSNRSRYVKFNSMNSVPLYQYIDEERPIIKHSLVTLNVTRAITRISSRIFMFMSLNRIWIKYLKSKNGTFIFNCQDCSQWYIIFSTAKNLLTCITLQKSMDCTKSLMSSS